MYAEWVVLLATSAIAMRLVRVVTVDKISIPVRRWLWIRNAALGEFSECPWCIGWWVTLVTFVAAYLLWPGHDYTASQIIVWAGSVCATNYIHAAVSNAASRVDDLLERHVGD